MWEGLTLICIEICCAPGEELCTAFGVILVPGRVINEFAVLNCIHGKVSTSLRLS